MKKILTFFILLFSFQLSYSQIEPEWVIRYIGEHGQDIANDIAVDNSGNIFITGYVETSSQGTDFITIKYNSAGVQQWVRTYNGPANLSDVSNAILVDLSGNVYITGYSRGIGSNDDYATIKYNSDGVLQWVKRYNGTGNGTDETLAIAADPSGNVLVTGRSRGAGSDSDFLTIKYSPDGDTIWTRRYNGIGNSSDQANAIAVDGLGNVFVTGASWIDTTAHSDIITLKYSNDGSLLWMKRYNGPISRSDYGADITVDQSGNIYVTGGSQETTTGTSAYATIKYDTDGTELWVRRWINTSGPATAVALDSLSNIYVTGMWGSTLKYDSEGVLLWDATFGAVHNWSIGVDPAGNVFVTGNNASNINLQNMITIKYDQDGQQEWIHDYNGPGNGWDAANKLAVDHLGNVYVTGFSTGNGTSLDITTLKFSKSLSIYKPQLNEKWIAGEVDTIKWSGGQSGQLFQIEFSIDNGNTYETLDFGIPADSGYYIWQLNDTILTTKAKIKLTDMVNNNITTESDSFRIKPYVLTRIDENGNYYEYRKNRDQWGFVNDSSSIWPHTWFNQFYYLGIDPYTQLFYPLFIVDSLFLKAKPFHHPDWLSWVRTFGISDCYANVDSGIYWQTALVRWRAVKKNNWGGSCFGIAAANAIAFSHRTEFTQAFPTFPAFVNPVSVVSDDGVKFVVNELFTHQYGNPTQANDPSALAKTPNQTLNEIRQMLLEDTAQVKTLSIYNNGGDGGHTILAYGLKQDPVQKNLFNIQVYDNSNPTSNNPITIDTSANGGTGNWSTPDWAGWGGNGKIHLEIPSIQYLNGATFPARPLGQSAFILLENVLEINYPNDTQIRIIDNLGNITGYFNNLVFNEIPASLSRILKNGSESPPYGYSLPTDNYSVVLNDFEEDIVETFFFSGNKSFVYERSGATQTQTDRLFFDGGVSVTNPDAQTKTVKLLNLINETTQEKLVVIRSIELAQNDSVKIENPDSNKVKLISYGSAKDYDIELNFVTENGLGRFGDFNIPLSANTSHTFVPEWTNLTNSQLVVLVDIGNNGTIDDTLTLVNQVTGLQNDQGSLISPDNYHLAQNYPNPFNPSTKITFVIPNGERNLVTLKVFDILGNEVATLVNEYREAGRYEVTFDASNLASGMYLYRLQSGSFVETKKMILIK